MFLVAVCPGPVSSAIPLDPNSVVKFVDPLPIPGAMPEAAPNCYEVGVWEISQKLHRDLPPTYLWGYGPTQETASYPASTFEVTRGVPIQVKWTNNLFDVVHPLPIDATLHWADPLGQGHTMNPYDGPVPIVTHLHGGEVEPQSDGGPDAWFTPGFALKGPGWMHETFNYPNEQPATTLWYHDHALGITRLNVYMGLAGFYIIRDPDAEPADLPSGPYEIPIAIQDRTLSTSGTLAYPSVSDNPDEHPYWVPEFFGDLIVVNGKIWPYLEVEPRKYRLRLLNGSDARFYGLRLQDKLAGTAGPAFHQIGGDGGYLPQPVVLNDPRFANSPRLVMAPGERADIIVDFTGYAPGRSFILTNNARSPFPKGAPPDPGTVGQIMEFRLVAPTGVDNSVIAAGSALPSLGAPVMTRTLTLNEVMGPGGPLAALLDGKMWDADVTELPVLGTTELWQIVNMTADTHPIHLHLTQFQVVNRQRFNVKRYMRDYEMLNPVIPAETTTNPPIDGYLQGPPRPPDPNELGWKDTVRMNPGEVTRILVRFAPVGSAEVTPYPFDATAEPGYVWHCHILEHEDNEMMRPYKVVAPPLNPSSVLAADSPRPRALLAQNRPNPFHPATEIRFTMPWAATVQLAVYDVAGREVRRLIEGQVAAGEHVVRWDGRDGTGRDVANGVYVCTLHAPGSTMTRKMMLLK
jgi:FtsP/CotA-like multicopper oxidase with cupredoxin domain